MVNEPTLPGYERVMEVRIPCSTETSDDGKQMTVETTVPENPDVEFKFYYANKSEVLSDPKLQVILGDQLGASTLSMPVMDPQSRRLIDPNSELLSEHEFIDQFRDDRQLLAELLIRYISNYHEVGSEDALGGHFTSVIHPETAIHGQMLVWGDILHELYNPGNDGDEEYFKRALPLHYYEVSAVLEERKALDELRAQSSPFRRLCEQIRLHTGEREALKSTDEDVLDEMTRELVDEWIAKFAGIDPEESPYPADIARAVGYLETQLGDRDQALELLDVPREIGMHPDKWLCNILHDIESGMAPADIPAHSSYWETRMSTDNNMSYDELVEKFGNTRQDILEEPQRRAFYSTHEVVTPKEDEIIRTWYSYQPTDEFDVSRIRYVLFLQQMFAAFASHPSIRILNNSREPARYDEEEDNRTKRQPIYQPKYQRDGVEPIYQSEYQRLGVDPLKQAINGELTSREIGKYYTYDVGEGATPMWRWGRNKATDSLGFNNYGDALAWIENGAQGV